MKLIYAGDAMCSWCYGFGKEMSALAERHPVATPARRLSRTGAASSGWR